MAIVAVFPLVLVRDALRVRTQVLYVKKDLSYVHCGEFPLVAWVGFSIIRGWGEYSRGCYINDRGQHVYAA